MYATNGSDAIPANEFFANDGLRHSPARADHAHTRISSSSNEQSQNLPFEGGWKALQGWFLERFEDAIPLSKQDLEYIDACLARFQLEMQEFIRICRNRTTGRVLNPIAIVKWLAQDPIVRGYAPKWTVTPAGKKQPDWGECPTCQSKAGLLKNGTPCPDCKLGQDLAQVQKQKKVQPKTATSDNIQKPQELAPTNKPQQTSTNLSKLGSLLRTSAQWSGIGQKNSYLTPILSLASFFQPTQEPNIGSRFSRRRYLEEWDCPAIPLG